MKNDIDPEELEHAQVAERRLRAMKGLGRKTRRATIHDVRPDINLDDRLRHVGVLTTKQIVHLIEQRKRRRGGL